MKPIFHGHYCFSSYHGIEMISLSHLERIEPANETVSWRFQRSSSQVSTIRHIYSSTYLLYVIVKCTYYAF